MTGAVLKPTATPPVAGCDQYRFSQKGNAVSEDANQVAQEHRPATRECALGALLQGRRGGVALEFALLLPILVFTLIGLWDFARVVAEDGRLSSAAMAGVHYGIQSAAHAGDTAGVTQAVRDDASDSAAALNVVAERYCSCPDGGAVPCNSLCATIGKPIMYVRVQVSETFRTMVTYPFVANPVPITREAQMRVE